jgi:hypothetical protein
MGTLSSRSQLGMDLREARGLRVHEALQVVGITGFVGYLSHHCA